MLFNQIGKLCYSNGIKQEITRNFITKTIHYILNDIVGDEGFFIEEFSCDSELIIKFFKSRNIDVSEEFLQIWQLELENKKLETKLSDIDEVNLSYESQLTKLNEEIKGLKISNKLLQNKIKNNSDYLNSIIKNINLSNDDKNELVSILNRNRSIKQFINFISKKRGIIENLLIKDGAVVNNKKDELLNIIILEYIYIKLIEENNNETNYRES
jgi:phage host-nuclease inhibitor protein Gam